MLKLYFNRRDDVLTFSKKSKVEEQTLIFGFNGVKKIYYKKELSGEDDILSSIANFSKKSQKLIISGAITDNYGIIRKSAIIAEDGKLLGISDMNLCLDKSPYSSGVGYRVYQTKIGRVGVIVDDDIIDIDGVKSMAQCGADVIICLISEEEKSQYNVLVRAYSFLFGLPIVIVSSSSVMAGDMNGEICGASRNEESRIIVPIRKNYRLCQTKKRGVKI